MASAMEQTNTDKALVEFGAGTVALRERLDDDVLLSQMELRFIDIHIHLFLVSPSTMEEAPEDELTTSTSTALCSISSSRTSFLWINRFVLSRSLTRVR